jgi:hypothetical protein
LSLHHPRRVFFGYNLPRILYAPDLPLIERYWWKTKWRTRAALNYAIGLALVTIAVSDVRSWLQHCRYAL